MVNDSLHGFALDIISNGPAERQKGLIDVVFSCVENEYVGLTMNIT